MASKPKQSLPFSRSNKARRTLEYALCLEEIEALERILTALRQRLLDLVDKEE